MELRDTNTVCHRILNYLSQWYSTMVSVSRSVRSCICADLRIYAKACSPSKEEFYGTHVTPSRSATVPCYFMVARVKNVYDVLRTTGSVNHCYDHQDHQDHQLMNSRGHHSRIFQLTSQIIVQRHQYIIFVASFPGPRPASRPPPSFPSLTASDGKLGGAWERGYHFRP